MSIYFSGLKGFLTASTFACALFSSAAHAFVAVQAEVGRRSGKIESDPSVSAAGTELQLTAQVDPIPLVPVGFGLTAATMQLSLSDSDTGGIDKLSGVFVAPMVSAWVPNPTDFKPFARLGYVVYGGLAGSGKTASGVEVSEAFSMSGPLLGLGVKWSFLPLTSVLLEYQIFNPKLKVTKLEIAGVDRKDGADAPTFRSNAILVGVEVGI